VRQGLGTRDWGLGLGPGTGAWDWGLGLGNTLGMLAREEQQAEGVSVPDSRLHDRADVILAAGR